MSNLILLTDDDLDILKANEKYLVSQGYTVKTAQNGREALERIREHRFSCIVLDVLLPDMDGFAICEEIRKQTSCPIIFLSCKDGEEDKIKGLMIGGDDYMSKPYSLKELLARIHAQIRRGQSGNIIIDGKSKSIHAAEQNIHFSNKEFDVFMVLYENLGNVVEQEEIYQKVWGAVGPDSNLLPVYINRLRKKIEDQGASVGAIETFFNHGYRLTIGAK